jgi:hypothetical protein
MAYDIATDPKTGDWLFSANRDIQHVEGEDVVSQRLRHRLKIVRGAWILDPSDGALGSRIEQAFRLPRGRVIREMPLIVQEALAPMSDDIDLQTVEVEEVTPTQIRVRIDYAITSGDDLVPAEERLSEIINFELF